MGRDEADLQSDAEQLRSRVAALEELLEVYETATTEQAERLENAMATLATQSEQLIRAERERVHQIERELEISHRVDQMQRELETARRIQTSILPPNPGVRGLEIAAAMQTAASVGGDYYDVIPTQDGCWIGIGDVTGHGLDAGLVMLMTQCAVSALCGTGIESPRAVISGVNRVLFENIRHRLKRDDHITFSLLRYYNDGRVVFAGAHEEMLISRASGGAIECIPTPGTWLGAMKDVGPVTWDSVLELSVGDMMVIYTDGMIEAMNGAREQFGSDRLALVLERVRAEPVEAIRDHLLAEVSRWEQEKADDATVIVVRRSTKAD